MGLDASQQKTIKRNHPELMKVVDRDEFYASEIDVHMAGLANRDVVECVRKEFVGNGYRRVWTFPNHIRDYLWEYQPKSEDSVLPCQHRGVNNIKHESGPEAYQCPVCGMAYLECEVKTDTDTEDICRDEEALQVLYEDRRMSTRDIAGLLDAKQKKVWYWIDKHDSIEARNQGQKIKYPKLADEEWFRERYVVRGLSTRDIASRVGCDRATAWHWLEKHDIEARDCAVTRSQKGASA